MERTLDRHLDAVFSSPAFGACLAGDYRTVEYPLSRTRQEGGATIRESGSIDLLYRSGGRWVILDYKTNRIASAADRAALEREYEPQIRGYAEAFTALTGEPAEGRLLFTDAGE